MKNLLSVAVLVIGMPLMAMNNVQPNNPRKRLFGSQPAVVPTPVAVIPQTLPESTGPQKFQLKNQLNEVAAAVEFQKFHIQLGLASNLFVPTIKELRELEEKLNDISREIKLGDSTLKHLAHTAKKKFAKATSMLLNQFLTRVNNFAQYARTNPVTQQRLEDAFNEYAIIFGYLHEFLSKGETDYSESLDDIEADLTYIKSKTE